MAAPIPRPMTHGSAKVPWEAKKPAASKTVSPGTGTPALSRKTPRNTIAYPYRARRFASSTGIVGVRELTRRQIEAGRRLQIRALGEQPRPRRARHALGFGDDRGLVQGQYAPVAHEPAPVHHHGSTSPAWPWCTKHETGRSAGVRCGRRKSTTMKSARLP